jgi:sugar lactone lactonase YvrE
VVVDPQGNVWARSFSRLLELPMGGGKAATPRKDLAAAVRFGRLYVDRGGNLLVPTGKGLGCRSPRGDWQIIRKLNGLPGDSVNVVTEDREGSLWVGISGIGLSRWLGRGRWESWTEMEGLSHDVVWALRRDAEDLLWAGTESGLSRFDQRAGRWRPWVHPAVGGGRIISLAATRDGKLLVGEFLGELVEIDPHSGSAVRYGRSVGLTSSRTIGMTVDRSGTLWVGTMDGLFAGRKTQAGLRFQPVKLIPEDPAPFICAVLCDRKGRLWVTTWHGLFLLDAGRWMHFTTADGLRHNGLMYLGEGPDDSIWISYREPFGTSRVAFEHGRLVVRHFSHANGLYSDKVLSVGADASGRMWLGTDGGVEEYDGRTWAHYDKSDGLIWNDCNATAFLADPDGSVWFGTSRGVSHFYARGAPPRPTWVPTVLTSVQLGGRDATLADGISVPYSQRAFRANFAALSFVNEESMRLHYRLNGLDTNWTEIEDNEARYAGLAPGNYTFEVQAHTSAGPWGPPAHYRFHIRPPVWLSLWAIVAEFLLLCLLARLFWKWRLRSVLRKQAALERAVDERTSELTRQKAEIESLLEKSEESARLKSEFLANISHEIRTPINGIIGMTDLMLRSELSADQAESLRLVKISADSLLSVINDVLDFSKIEAARLDLDTVAFSPRELVRDTVKSMEVLAHKKNLGLRCGFGEGLPERLSGDPVRLRQVLVNLIGKAMNSIYLPLSRSK